MGFLKLIGAVSAAEHSKLDAKYKAAIKDLATEIEVRETAQSERDRLKDKVGAKALHRGLDDYMAEINRLHEEIAALRPDAEAMRAKRTRDREQKAERRTPAKAVAAKGRGK